MGENFKKPITEKRIALTFDREAFQENIISDFSKGDNPQEESVIVRYYNGIKKAQEYLNKQEGDATRPIFEPNRQLPELSEDFLPFYAPAKMQLLKIGEYQNRTLKLFNLMIRPPIQPKRSPLFQL